MCVKDTYYPDLFALDIPDPSNADFTAASAGAIDVKCLPCPPPKTKSGAICPPERTICSYTPVLDAARGMLHAWPKLRVWSQGIVILLGVNAVIC